MKETLMLSTVIHDKDNYDHTNWKNIAIVIVDEYNIKKEVIKLIKIAKERFTDSIFEGTLTKGKNVFEAIISCESTGVFEAFEIFTRGELICVAQEGEEEFDLSVEDNIRLQYDIPKEVDVVEYFRNNNELDYYKIKKEFERKIELLSGEELVDNILQTFLN